MTLFQSWSIPRQHRMSSVCHKLGNKYHFLLTWLSLQELRKRLIPKYYWNYPSLYSVDLLIHWGRVTHICASELTIIGSDNGLSPGWRQAIMWTNAGMLLIRPPRNKLQKNFIRNSYNFIQENLFENVVWKMAAIFSWPQCFKKQQQKPVKKSDKICLHVSALIQCDIAIWWVHYTDVIMGTIASQITSLTIVYSAVNSDADQRKHQSSTSLAFLWGIHWGPVNSLHKWPVTRKMSPFDDVIMICAVHSKVVK